MDSTAQLKKEHNAIKIMLDILDRMCKRLQEGEKINSEHLDKLLEFLKVFVDKCHHTKEEELLFRAMEKAGIPKEQGPISVMLLEHKKGREYVELISEGISEYKAGNDKAVSKIVENAKAYIRTLFAHIDKENEVLYPMADARLSKKVDEQLSKKFEQIEIEKIGPGTHERFHELIKNLKAIYLR